MPVNLHVDGYPALLSNPNTSHLDISMNQTHIPEGFVIPVFFGIPVSSNPNAPTLQASPYFPTEILLDPLRFQSHIRDELPAVLGFRLPSIANAGRLAERLDRVAVNNGREQNNMFPMYDFSAVMENVNDDPIADIDFNFDQILEDIDVQFSVHEDELLGEEVTSGTSRTAIEKLKPGRFIGDEKEEELGSCCICLEEMSCGGKELVGLPNCQHIFHENCILQWLDKANSCPLCRTAFED